MAQNGYVNMSNQSRQDLAYRTIKERILNLAYRPGQPLVETDLAAELGISRTPIREALRRLENEGLVVNTGGRGRSVYGLSVKDTRELFDIKIAVESLVARRAAERVTEAQLKHMRQALVEMRAAAAAGDTEAWLQADGRFHDNLFAAAAMPRASQLIQGLNEQWHRLRVGFVALGLRMGQSAEEHQAILDALEARDPATAARVMTSHLEQVGELVVKMLESVVMPLVGE